MEEYQLVALVLPPIPVIADVHGEEVKQEPVRMTEHGVAMHQHVNVGDIYNVHLWAFYYCHLNYYLYHYSYSLL